MQSEVRSPGRARAWTVVVVLAAICLPMFWALGRWPLLDPDEGRNAEVAREMLSLGSWVVPHFNGLPFLDKPPLLFWAIAGSFRVLGPTELAARLPAVLSAVVTVLLTFALTRMLARTRTALVAATVVATAPLIFVYARLTIFDMLFTALVTMALTCLVRQRLGGRRALWLGLAAFAMGLACLTKGPVGVALPLIAWAAGRGALPTSEPPRERWPIVLAVGVFVATVTPWLVLVIRAEPAFLHYAVIDETLLRFTSTARFHRGEPVYYPLLVAVTGLGVWAAVLLGTAPALVRRASAPVAFAARVAAAIIVFFSISASKRAGYVLPALVPLAIVIAAGIEAAPRQALAALRITAAGAIVVGLVAMLMAWSPAVLAALPGGELGRAVDHRTLLAAATFLLAWASITLATGRGSSMAPLVLAAVVGPGLYLSLSRPLAAYAEGRSARHIARSLPADSDVLCFRHFRPSLPFYLGNTVRLASTDGHELTSNYVSSQHGRFLADGQLMRPASARAEIRNAPALYVLTGSSWTPTFATLRPGPLTMVATDRKSRLWATP